MRSQIFSPFIFSVLSVFFASTMVLGQNSDDAPLNFTYDPIDGRTIWIKNRTSTETVQKIEYRRLFRDANKTVQTSTGQWRQMVYDPQSPVWSKPDGICAEYELSTTTGNEKNYLQILEAPVVQLKSASKLRPSRIYFDPIRNRILAELNWGNDFDYWTAAGAVLIQSAPWAKLLQCQSLFKYVVPPPTIENRGTVLSFDPEYARNNCTFLVGVNGTLQMMQTPSNRGQSIQAQFNNQLMPVNRQLMQQQLSNNQQSINNQQIMQQQQQMQNELLMHQQNQQLIQHPIDQQHLASQQINNQQFTQPQPGTIPQLITGQLSNSGPFPQQSIAPDPNCSKIDFSTSNSNESLQLNLTCDSVSGSTAFCLPPQRQCRLDCSPIDIRAYNMQDSNGDFLKIDWQFPQNIQSEIRRYQIRYAEANVTFWNTVLLEKEVNETTSDSNRNYVEIKKFGTSTSSTPGATNFTIQICANLGEICTTPLQWEQERKYAIGYTPRAPQTSANLVQAGSSTSRRRGHNGADAVFRVKAGMIFWFFAFLIKTYFII